MNSIEVRQRLVEALLLDLVGPFPGTALESETLSQTPSRWYLTGLLIPAGASEAHSDDATDDEQIDLLSDAGGSNDAAPPEPPSARRANLPSSIGLSVLLPVGATTLRVAALERNIEAKILVHSEPFADHLERHFEGLVQSGAMRAAG